jgi:hypothetical protein
MPTITKEINRKKKTCWESGKSGMILHKNSGEEENVKFEMKTFHVLRSSYVNHISGSHQKMNMLHFIKNERKSLCLNGSQWIWQVESVPLREVNDRCGTDVCLFLHD